MDHGCRCKDRLYRAGQSLEKGYIERFFARLRDELFNGEIFYSLREGEIVIESWRRHYNASGLVRRPVTNRQHRKCCARRVAGCATSTGSAGHAGAEANLKLTFDLDHSVGADSLLGLVELNDPSGFSAC
jgi:Integrase core domain